MRLALPLVALSALIASSAAVPSAEAQKPPTVKHVDIDDITLRPERHDALKARRETLSRSIVQVRVTPDLGPHIRPIGPQGHALGAATLIRDARLGEAPVLITSEFLVRDAREVELLVGDEPVKVKVLRSDPRLGLAVIEAPKEIIETMTPLEVVPEGKTVNPRLVTLAHEAGGDLLIFRAAIGEQGQGPLAYYHTAHPALSGGYPLITDQGQFYGLYAFKPTQLPDLGLTIVGEHISRFLDPPEETIKTEALKLNERGSSRRRLR